MAEGSNDLDLRRSADLARRVLLTMGKWRIPATPENYQLWYEYVLAENEDLVKDVEKHASTGAGFTVGVCKELVDKHLDFGSQDGEGSDNEEAKRATQQIIQSVLKEVLLTGDAASEYGDSLTEFSQAITATSSATDLQARVLDLMANTARMSEQSKQFQERLEEAKQQTEELRQRLATVEAEAMTDGLTGLPNRRSLEVRLQELINNPNNGGTTSCIGMVDADHFKSFNDTYGHSVGDQVLKMLAASFNEILTEPCFAARYGGEEFTIVFPNTHPADARATADALRESVAGKQLKKSKTGEALRQVTVSIGLTAVAASDTIESALERADEALYLAKSNGRNCVCQAMPNDVSKQSA